MRALEWTRFELAMVLDYNVVYKNNYNLILYTYFKRKYDHPYNYLELDLLIVIKIAPTIANNRIIETINNQIK